jgi:serine/threonine protein kinase
VKRQVAVKVIKAEIVSGKAFQRFDLERQALAMMDHPTIAKVFDAGSTEDGNPYLVMEYVSGLPLTTYCNRKRLGARERIELMVTVCKGVQHAHQKAIMHRDLKPSNSFTQLGATVGTLGYMSPEQGINLRALPRCVTWCGTSTAMTRAKRVIMDDKNR